MDQPVGGGLIAYSDLRSDWYFGGDYMARLLKRAASGTKAGIFVGFPRQWIPLFEYLGIAWSESRDPDVFLPFVSHLDEAGMRSQVEEARAVGQLRLLVETVASADIVVGETLQRLDTAFLAPDEAHDSSAIRLSNWHGYLRPEVRAFEEELATWRARKAKAAFMPCGRARPYNRSGTHRRLIALLADRGVDLGDYDLIVITSLGPVPESLWQHPVVMRYDTGVRDIYRMLTLLRRLLKPSGYESALDCMGFRPYRDILQIVAREGMIGELSRPGSFRGRSIPTYRGAATA